MGRTPAFLNADRRNTSNGVRKMRNGRSAKAGARGRSCLRTHKNRRAAFTLIEVLVVVAIIALLLAILLPSLAKAREASRAAVCLSNLKQMGMGVLMYTEEY